MEKPGGCFAAYLRYLHWIGLWIRSRSRSIFTLRRNPTPKSQECGLFIDSIRKKYNNLFEHQNVSVRRQPVRITYGVLDTQWYLCGFVSIGSRDSTRNSRVNPDGIVQFVREGKEEA